MEITIEQIVVVAGGLMSTLFGFLVKYAWTKNTKALEDIVKSNGDIVTRMAVMENNMEQVSEARHEMKEILKDIITLQNQTAKAWSVQNKMEHKIDLLEERIRGQKD